jgi:alpha-L-rhamnosidase
MKKGILFSISILFYCQVIAQRTEVLNLQCEYHSNPLGIENPHPQLCWQLNSKQRNVIQTAYRILVSDNEQLLEKNIGNIWDSKKVNSNQSLQIAYAGQKLHPAKEYYWKVMVWNNQNNSSKWSKQALWQMGLPAQENWKGAQWLAYEKLPDSLRIVPGIHGNGDKKLGPGKDILPLFRKEFVVKKTIKKATVFIAGLGHFDMSLNGKKVGNHFLDAGWTQYDKNALYVTFDITNNLQKGKNVLGVMLGNGFYYIPRERYRKITIAYGYPKMICRVLVEYSDGSMENIISDKSWKTTPGPITFSSIYGGEDYDATVEQSGWNTPSFNDRSWKAPTIVDGPSLTSQTATPLRILDSFSIQKITQPKPGIYVYDFGQNASGIFKISVKGKKGDKIIFRPAELLTDDGLITQQAVGAPVYFTYTLKGTGEETWQPRFTYYGFRYIQVEGSVPQDTSNPNGLPVITGMRSLHTRNSAARIGNFSCSNNLFNRTYTLIDWAIKSNMASVFTDCPHREKLGWLEEAHLMGPSLRYNYDIASLCKKVVDDMINAQTEEGLIPDIAPEFVHFVEGFRDSPEWGSSGIILPWYLYEWYGDTKVLEEAYPMMQRYVNYLQRKSSNYILSYGLGDWFDIGPKDPGESQLTPKGVTATAIFYYDLNIISKVAALLGKQQDEKKYDEAARKVKSAYNKEFFNTDTKQYATGSQTANAMSVYMELVEPEYKDAVVENIVKDIHARNNSLTAGDIGYRYLLRVLDDNNRSDVIYEMNSRSDVPGYGFQLAHGATALTESWQAYRFVSNNHFMLGHLMEWFYSGLGGIRPAKNSVAFKQIDIRPEPVGDVTFASANYLSPYGNISSAWKKNNESFELNIDIPVNTTATIYLPVKGDIEITESNKPLSNRKDVKFLRYEQTKALVAVGSGHYIFKVKRIGK